MSLIGDMTQGEDGYEMHRNVTCAIEFHNHFHEARGSMQKAADLMLQCYKITKMKKYDRRHKIMVKLIREWNKTDDPTYYARNE